MGADMMTTTTDMQHVSVGKLIPYANNARTHSPEQVNKLRSSLRKFGFINPVIIDRDYTLSGSAAPVHHRRGLHGMPYPAPGRRRCKLPQAGNATPHAGVPPLGLTVLLCRMELIRCAAKEQIDLVLHGGLGADHNDRGSLNPGQNILSAKPRQHQVEQNEIGAARFQEQQRLRPGVSALHRIACPL